MLNCFLMRDFVLSQVMINNGFTPDKEDFEFCARVDNMVIPAEGFFGISAATGGLAGEALCCGLQQAACSLPSIHSSRKIVALY